MTAIVCTLLSGAFFYLSTNLGEVWWLAWLAPVPVLWLAFGGEKNWVVAASAFAGVALGATNLLGAYGAVFPWPVLATIFIVPPALFALIVLGTRLVARRVHPAAGMFAFAALWTTWDFLASFGPDGTAASPAYSQVGAPILIQSAALFGLWSITFLLGFVAAGSALTLRTRKFLPAALALAAFALNAGYGAWRIAQAPQTPTIRAGLVANDRLADAAFADDRDTALAVIRAYAGAAGTLDRPQLIVMPEHLAILRAAWRDDAQKILQGLADATGAIVVIGLDERDGTVRHNIAWVFRPRAGNPLIYEKRRLVPGLERMFTPGTAPLPLGDRKGVEICKDMDFQAMLRADAVAVAPDLMAVPAWDFERDAFGHARMAILRGVENGFAMARAARNGLLSLSDAYGRISAMRASGPGDGFAAPGNDGFNTLMGSVPLGSQGGRTLYDRIGDIFAWAALALAATLLILAFVRGRVVS